LRRLTSVALAEHGRGHLLLRGLPEQFSRAGVATQRAGERREPLLARQPATTRTLAAGIDGLAILYARSAAYGLDALAGAARRRHLALWKHHDARSPPALGACDGGLGSVGGAFEGRLCILDVRRCVERGLGVFQADPRRRHQRTSS
jgi:hypothetical protein